MKVVLPIQRPGLRWLYSRSRKWAIPSLMFLAALRGVRAVRQRSVGQRGERIEDRVYPAPSPLALSLVAIVIGGLMFAYGEGQAKKDHRRDRLRRRHGYRRSQFYELAVPVVIPLTAGQQTHYKQLSRQRGDVHGRGRLTAEQSL